MICKVKDDVLLRSLQDSYYVYYIRIDVETIPTQYKIGITANNNTIHKSIFKRFERILEKRNLSSSCISIIDYIPTRTKKEALLIESFFKKRMNTIDKSDCILGSGHTETSNNNILLSLKTIIKSNINKNLS